MIKEEKCLPIVITMEDALILQKEILDDINAWEFTEANDPFKYMFYIEGVKDMANNLFKFIQNKGKHVEIV